MPCKGTDDIGNEEAKHSVEEEEKKDDYDDHDNEFEKEDPTSQLDTVQHGNGKHLPIEPLSQPIWTAKP